MAAADDGDDQRLIRRGGGGGEGLGHGPVPGQLGVDEALHPVGVRRRARPFEMLVIDLAELVAVDRGRRRRVRDPFAIRLGHGVPASFPDGGDQGAIDVERHHGHPVDAGEVEQRHIQRRIETPHPVPFHRLKKRRLVKFAGHPGIEHRLHAARKHLESEDHRAAPGMERGDGLELPEMMLGIVVSFAEYDHARGRRPGEQPVAGERRGRAGLDPDTRRHAGRGVLIGPRRRARSQGRRHQQRRP